MQNSPTDSDDEFFECSEPFPSKFYAVAVPRESPGAGLFSNITHAKNRLKCIKGSRLKTFDSIKDASKFSESPVLDDCAPPVALEGEAANFSSVKQADLLRFRKSIETNDISSIEMCISVNPMYLLTGCDTPTILQLVFRFNAIHIAGKSGHAEVIKLIIYYLESPEFWVRIYPNANSHTAEARRRRVLDLYLNSPETGSLSSPLHLASKFGHVDCVRVLASHPAAILELRDSSGATAMESACIRLTSVSLQEKTERRQAICRALDERYVVLIDSYRTRDRLDAQTTILPQPLMARQLYQLLSSTNLQKCPGIINFCPQLARTSLDTAKTTRSSQPHRPTAVPPFSPRADTSTTLKSSPSADAVDLLKFGGIGVFGGLRAILGPLSHEEAEYAIGQWRRPSNPFWVNLRMMDSEKGYERYGRNLAVQFDTNWTEYWSFLGDFANLKSQYGLKLLDNYLSHFYTECNNTGKHLSHDDENKIPCQKLTYDNEYKPPGVCGCSPKATPIKRTKRHAEKLMSEITETVGDNKRIWSEYRDINNPASVLSDSMASSSPSSSESSQNSEKNEYHATSTQISPVISLLNNFIVSSPLRLLLPDSCVATSPLLCRPERRISLFARIETARTPNFQQSEPPMFKTPLRLGAPVSSRARFTHKSVLRRRTSHGIWPSLIDKSAHSTSIQPSITPTELAAHVAITSNTDTHKYKDRSRQENYEYFPFVRRWKEELDLSLRTT